YQDDLVIKSRTEEEIMRDIEETFKTLREINMKLNPKKCTFGIEEGIFLGYKVNIRGLKVCPDKTIEAEETFKQMKRLIAELLMLVAPIEKEELIVYLAATKETASAILMTERETKQMHIYFVSRALRGLKINYTSMEKLVLALLHAKKDYLDTLMAEEQKLPEPWILFTDGSSCIDGSRAGLILTNPEGMEFTYALRFKFDATNNEAKFEALIAGLKIAEQMGVKNLWANVDSRFKAFSIKQIPRSENQKADVLSKIASTSFTHLSKQALVEELKEKSISMMEVLAVVEEEGDTWMTPIFKYLTDETLPAEEKKARAVKLATDYFTKWIEAKLVATITGNQIQKFMWDNIVCKFKLPREIISDNGKQFRDDPFKDWCKKLCIRHHFASVKHPQTNGLVERANGSLEEGIKASNGDTPFSLTYGTEAVISAEIGMPTLKTAEVDLVRNNEALKINLDLLEERREEAAIHEAKNKAKWKKYYNSKV
nr:reverse transcriptase domain-containing protein [Tanacetum cinerariifolium]